MDFKISFFVFVFLPCCYLACRNGTDCADSDCCLSNNRPIGKRSDPGHCSALGTTGSSCIVKYGSGKPADMVFECPCVSGLTCQGTGKYDVPLGEIGICGP